MFRFLRKHQKYFFYVITTIIIITFSFFGSYSTFEKANKKKKDRPVTKAIDGREINEAELKAFSLFLSVEGDLRHPNLLNDGVIQKDFIKTRLAEIIAEKYLNELKQDFNGKVERIQKYAPYVHSQVPFISAKAVWGHFCPNLEANLNKLQKKTEIDLEYFRTLFSLYEAQNEFSPDSLKKILYYQQSQYDWIIPDERILHDDLSLFGFSSVSDWFGPNFLDIVSQFIINTSIMAEKKGYKVSNEEALADLLQLLEKRLENSKSKNNFDYFNIGIRSLGMNETQVVDIWKKILLFRKYFADVGNTVFLDSMCHKEILTFANEKANLMLYELPPSLKLNNFEDFLKLQMYLKASALPSNELISSSFKSIEELEKSYPELVEKLFVLKVKHVNIKDVGLKIGEKQLWAWQLLDNNWNLLLEEFASLRSIKASTKEERFSALESFSKAKRSEIDNFSRKKMIESDRNLITLELKNAEEKEVNLKLRLKGKNAVLKVNIERLLPLLESASNLKEPAELLCYSDNKEDFYQITVVSQDKNKSIVSFADAKKEGLIDELLEKELRAKYKVLSKEEKFRNENGEKPFLEVKDKVGAVYFADVLKKIDLEESIKEQKLDSYLTKFLYLHMNNMKKEAANGREIKNPWAPIVKKIAVTRAGADERMKKDIFLEDAPSVWSDVSIDKNNNVSFYKFLGREKDDKTNIKEMEKAKDLLSLEAKITLAKKILEDLKSKKLIKILTKDV